MKHPSAIGSMSNDELKKAYLELYTKYTQVVAHNKTLEVAYLKIKWAINDPELVKATKPPGEPDTKPPPKTLKLVGI